MHNLKTKPPKPLALIILDGFGIRPPSKDNAITNANTPCLDKLMAKYPLRLLSASGNDVGLPEGQMGNSEVGHLTIGAGRVIDQDLTRITKAIHDGTFDTLLPLQKTFAHLIQTNTTLHILGLLSEGGVHSHSDHIFHLIALAKKSGVQKILVHAFLDGRDTPPKSAEQSLKKLQALLPTGIATISGRFYAMDRDKRWERTEAIYNLLTEGHAEVNAQTALQALFNAYDKNETDEFVKPTRLANFKPIENGDSVIVMNFRSDRVRQLCYAFLDPNFRGFKRQKIPHIAHFITLTDYADDISSEVLFKTLPLKNILGEHLQNNNLSQLRIAETEKYAHVTFFLNGGREAPFQNETRVLIPSPKVNTYDLKPDMSALSLTDEVLKAIHHAQFDVIIVNFANADMVGHTGNYDATIKAIQTLDTCLGKIVEALLKVGGAAIITADHGNAEHMYDETTDSPHTAHTTEPVPFIYVGDRAKNKKKSDPVTSPEGTLADIAPTMLTLLGLDIPKEMTGKSLIS